MSRLFKSFAKDSFIRRPFNWLEFHNVMIGSKVFIGSGTTLTSWKLSSDSVEGGKIIIEDFVSIGEDAHITAAMLIHIGKNVLTGKKSLLQTMLTAHQR